MYSCLTQEYDSLDESETVWTCVWGSVYSKLNLNQGDNEDKDIKTVPTLQDVIYTGSSAGHIKLWNLIETSNTLELNYICKQKSAIVKLLLNTANTILVSKTLNGVITIFDTYTMDVKYRFKIESIRNVNIQYSIDEMFVLTESDNRCLSFYDITNGQITSSYDIGENFTTYILSRTGESIIVGYNNGDIKSFDTTSGEINMSIINPNIGSVTCLTICYKNFNLLIGFESGIIKHYTVKHGEIIKIYEKPHKTNIVSICINPNNRTFATLSKDLIIKIWNFNELLPETKMKTHKELCKHIKYKNKKLNSEDDIEIYNKLNNIKQYLFKDNNYNFIPDSLQQNYGQLVFSRDGKKIISVIHQFIVLHSCPKSLARI